MSLINDALKQIKQARQQSPTSNPPLLPVESDEPDGFGWVLAGIIILLVAAAGVFVGVSLSKPAPSVPSATPPKTHLVPVTTPAMQPLRTADAAPIVTNPTKRVAVMPPATNGTPSNSNPVVVSSKLPELKLQGILFAATQPCAIVNGQTVFVGDRVNNFRVAMISRDSITLRNQTETRVLSLNPQ